MSWKRTDKLMDTIKHYSKFPATGVSLRQMVQFGEKPSTGTVAYINLSTPMGLETDSNVNCFQEPFSAHPNSSPKSFPSG